MKLRRPGCPLLLVGCLTIPVFSCSQPAEHVAETTGAMSAHRGLFHGQLLASKKLQRAASPYGAHLRYFGGRVVSNIQVVQVIYGSGSYIPEVTGAASPNMATFFEGVLNSPHVDWLSEYNTNTLPGTGTNQTIGRGTFAARVTITPSEANNGPTIDDLNVQDELSAQIQAGNLPAPTKDALGNNNTYYAVFFPHGQTITLGPDDASCSTFCAYHGTIANAGSMGEVYYGVHPDYQAGSGCERGCGAASTEFGKYTQVASHEMVETMTDPEVGVATYFGPPLAWYDDGLNQEIADLCFDQNGRVVGGDGVTYDVQAEFSNSQDDCVIDVPPKVLTVDPSVEICRNTPGSATVDVVGGAQGFAGDVTLSLIGVSPAPPVGGEIGATFDPNPVSTPPTTGAKSAMRIVTSASTPLGTYALTVQAASPALVKTATTAVAVVSEVPGAPILASPPDDTTGASATPTFSWSAASAGRATYTVDIFSGSGCTGQVVHSYSTSDTSFTAGVADALAPFGDFSWRVTAANACGAEGSTSACFRFTTQSCALGGMVSVNGGFESGFDGWSRDGQIPAPAISTERPHSGSYAVRLGTVAGNINPFGESSISQILTLRADKPSALVYWMWGFSRETSTDYGRQYVRVTPIAPAGPTVDLMVELDDAQTYERREFSLAQFAGQTVKLTFGVFQDGVGFPTGMFIDDVSVIGASCGSPDFALHAQPAGSGAVCAGAALDFTIGVESVNGPNFSTPVQLTAGKLPPGTTATFAKNPIGPGESTTLRLQTTRPSIGDRYQFDVTGLALAPPPAGIRTVQTSLVIDANPPSAPAGVSPRDGAVNLPRRPTLTWTIPFVADLKPGASAAAVAVAGADAATGVGPAPGPRFGTSSPMTGGPTSLAPVPFAFGASKYHVQVARDVGFTQLVSEVDVTDNQLTLPADLDIATQYFWRVSASNQCGAGVYSNATHFMVGACSDTWTTRAPVPLPVGLDSSTAVASPSTGKIYLIGGSSDAAGTNPRFNSHFWIYDPASDSWTQKPDLPAPGVGANQGAAAEVDGTIYVFGGYNDNSPQAVTWRYHIASDTWSRAADLPIYNDEMAVTAIGGQIYLAYGSSFGIATWQYDPVADRYTKKANALGNTSPGPRHAVALAGEMHVFGADGYRAHVIYNPIADSWRKGPDIPFGVRDPAVGALGGKAVVVGGYPARTQIFDPATNSWSESAPVTGAGSGVDYAMGAVLGHSFHLIGGYSGGKSVATHWQLHACNVGTLSSATLLPFVVDGDGSFPGIGNERTTLIVHNLSGEALSATCILYNASGGIDGSLTFGAAVDEVKSVPDVLRAIRGRASVQNSMGSLAIYGTGLLQASASVMANDSADIALEDGQALSGAKEGYLPLIQSRNYKTQAVFSNLSGGTALLQLIAYPSGGGDAPLAASVVTLKPHATSNYLDIASQLRLPRGGSGQLSWSANQPVAVVARSRTTVKSYSGFEPVRHLGDLTSSATVPYVEDTAAFGTNLEISNPGSIPANVTVRFADGTTGTITSRDVQVAINSAVPIADVVRWVLRSSSRSPSERRGFLMISTPQAVTAQGRIINRTSGDPSVPDQFAGVSRAFTPVIVSLPSAAVRSEELSVSMVPALLDSEPSPGDPAVALALGEETTTTTTTAMMQAPGTATTPTTSRFAVSNPNDTLVTVQITATAANGAGSSALLTLTLAPHQQYFTEDLAASLHLPPGYLGSAMVQSNAPILLYNQRRTGTAGATVPVHGL